MNKNERENVFRKKLKQNNRWSNFQRSVNDNKETPILQNRFSNFKVEDNGENNNRHSRFKKRSKFEKRIYKSKFNKEETMDYFNTQKNATQRSASLFDFAQKPKKQEKKQAKPNENLNKDQPNQNLNKDKPNENLNKDQPMGISQDEKSFILNKYMYEEESDEEDIEETEVNEVISEKNDIISF